MTTPTSSRALSTFSGNSLPWTAKSFAQVPWPLRGNREHQKMVRKHLKTIVFYLLSLRSIENIWLESMHHDFHNNHNPDNHHQGARQQTSTLRERRKRMRTLNRSSAPSWSPPPPPFIVIIAILINIITIMLAAPLHVFPFGLFCPKFRPKLKITL